MRRQEFGVQDKEEIEQFLREKHDGVLTFTGPDGWPKAVPLNYAYHAGTVYFHGSKMGEKMSGLAADPRAEFVVYEAHAFIPSYFPIPSWLVRLRYSSVRYAYAARSSKSKTHKKKPMPLAL